MLLYVIVYGQKWEYTYKPAKLKINYINNSGWVFLQTCNPTTYSNFARLLEIASGAMPWETSFGRKHKREASEGEANRTCRVSSLTTNVTLLLQQHSVYLQWFMATRTGAWPNAAGLPSLPWAADLANLSGHLENWAPGAIDLEQTSFQSSMIRGILDWFVKVARVGIDTGTTENLLRFDFWNAWLSYKLSFEFSRPIVWLETATNNTLLCGKLGNPYHPMVTAS